MSSRLPQYRIEIELDTLKDMQQAFAAVCKNNILPKNTTYTGVGGYHPYFIISVTYAEITGIFDGNSPFARYTASGGYERGTSAIRFTELVGCVDQHQQSVVCGGYLGNVGGIVSRLQYEAVFTLRVAQTGEILTTKTMKGNLPDCPSSYTANGPNAPHLDIGNGWLILSEPVHISIFDDLLATYTKP